MSLLCFLFLLVYKNYSKPQNWRKNIWELDPTNPENNGMQNEDLIVWMRTAALPTFRKLYRRLDRSSQTAGYMSGLTAGNYKLKVEYSEFFSFLHYFKTCKDFFFLIFLILFYFIFLQIILFVRFLVESVL